MSKNKTETVFVVESTLWAAVENRDGAGAGAGAEFLLHIHNMKMQ